MRRVLRIAVRTAAVFFAAILVSGFLYFAGRGAANKVNHLMNYNVEPQPLAGEIQAVEVPVFFFLGRHDYNTPSELAAEYLTRLHAPLKSLTWFERSAHFPFFEEPIQFTTEMRRAQSLTQQFWKRRLPPSVGFEKN